MFFLSIWAWRMEIELISTPTKRWSHWTSKSSRDEMKSPLNGWVVACFIPHLNGVTKRELCNRRNISDGERVRFDGWEESEPKEEAIKNESTHKVHARMMTRRPSTFAEVSIELSTGFIWPAESPSDDRQTIVPKWRHKLTAPEPDRAWNAIKSFNCF